MDVIVYETHVTLINHLLTYYKVSFLYTMWCRSSLCFLVLTLVVFFLPTLYCIFMMFFFIYMLYMYCLFVMFFILCDIFPPGVLCNPHDLLRPYGCAMSFIMFHVFDRCIGLVLHTWCVVLKHFPCLCKMAFLFVCCCFFWWKEGGGYTCS